ncbi:MAG: hypothetical protein NTAFB01_25850 [Nitrospira sp.]
MKNRSAREEEPTSPYRWSHNKPTRPGWYWFRGLAHEADQFIVLVDQAGEFQWPDGGFQEVSLAHGEWAGPIEVPKE